MINVRQKTKNIAIWDTKKTRKYDIYLKPGLWQQTNEIIKALENKKNKMPTINDAILTMKLVNKIYKY